MPPLSLPLMCRPLNDASLHPLACHPPKMCHHHKVHTDKPPRLHCSNKWVDPYGPISGCFHLVLIVAPVLSPEEKCGENSLQWKKKQLQSRTWQVLFFDSVRAGAPSRWVERRWVVLMKLHNLASRHAPSMHNFVPHTFRVWSQMFIFSRWQVQKEGKEQLQKCETKCSGRDKSFSLVTFLLSVHHRNRLVYILQSCARSGCFADVLEWMNTVHRIWIEKAMKTQVNANLMHDTWNTQWPLREQPRTRETRGLSEWFRAFSCSGNNYMYGIENGKFHQRPNVCVMCLSLLAMTKHHFRKNKPTSETPTKRKQYLCVPAWSDTDCTHLPGLFLLHATNDDHTRICWRHLIHGFFTGSFGGLILGGDGICAGFTGCLAFGAVFVGGCLAGGLGAGGLGAGGLGGAFGGGCFAGLSFDPDSFIRYPSCSPALYCFKFG